MNPIKHPSNNARLTPPPGVSEEHCVTLHITRVSHPHPIEPDKLMAGVISYWQPSPEELAALNAGKPLFLSFWGATHPPVAVGVEAARLAHQTSQVTDVMQLAESVGLIGPASRTGDLHAAIERFARAIQSRNGNQTAPARPEIGVVEPARADILERLSYHQLERDDLSIDDCLDVLASGWKKARGRTERQMVMQILALLAAQPAASEGEQLTRFCPGCGSVGEVEEKYRDCCPDGNSARMIPEPLARKCHDLFRLALEAASTASEITDAQITAGAAVKDMKGKPIGRNVAIDVHQAMVDAARAAAQQEQAGDTADDRRS